MLTTQLITATELHDRYVRLAERGLFPDLIRRLIIASDSTVRWIHFRAHEGIAIGGWDGRIEQANGAVPYVPSGGSRWELGTNQDALTKIKSDFAKRNKTPEADAGQLALIFVVIRRRADKEDWAKEFEAASPYREIHILDCDDLETWLQQHPGIHIWLSVLLGKYVEGATDLESWWLDWAAQTTPEMQPNWMLAGRASSQNRLVGWLTESGNIGQTLSIFAGTADEARAFIASCILTIEAERQQALLSRTIVVKSEALWDQILRTEEKLLLIPAFASPNFSQLCAAANRQGHQVLMPRSSIEAKHDDTVVPPLNKELLQQALESAGFSPLDAGERASLARRSFTAFHRTLLTDKSLQRLWWQQTEPAQQLLPLLLLGRWQSDSTGDQQIVEHLTGQSYPVIEKQLQAWARQPDTPVRQVDGGWFILDPADVWEQTAPFLTQDLLVRFGEAVQHVLGLPLARFNLPPSERRFANLRGIYDDYSGTLRQGLTSSLALLSTHAHPAPAAGAVLSLVESQVRILLENALNEPAGHLLSSLDYHLPILAEVAPNTFLTAILRDLRRHDTALIRLFDEEEALTHRTAHHTGLLWALEGLAWPVQFLSDASLALAGLARLDPGGQLSNRPINSLRTIFLGWRPQTNASVEERLTVIDRIRNSEPEVSWRLIKLLLPSHHDVSFGTHVPAFHWRDWEVNPDKGTSTADYFDFIAGLTERLLEDVGTDPERWSQLIGMLPELWDRLPEENLGERLLTQLLQLADLPIPDTDRQALLKELRSFLNRHRSMPDARWAWNEQQLGPIQTLYDHLQPTTEVERLAWLFDQWPQLPEGIKMRRHAESEVVIRERQEQALGELLAAGGVGVIDPLLLQVPSAFWLGYVCGRSMHLTQDDKLQLFQQYAASAEEPKAQFGRGLAASFTRTLGDESAALLAREHHSHWDTRQVAEWLVTMPMNSATWQLAKELDAEESFWQSAHDFVQNDEEAPEAIQCFLAHNRPAAAAHMLSMLQRHDDERLPAELVIKTLNALYTAQIEEGQPLVQRYELETLLDELVFVPNEYRTEAIQLAFLFSPATTLRNPRLLDEELQRSPDFFVELLSALYKPDDESKIDVESLTDAQKQYKVAIAERAWSILHNWETVPGAQPDGSLDGKWLTEWVAESSRIASERGVTTGFDIQLGLILSHAPADTDGMWPPVAVCEILEAKADNETVSRHVHMGRYNMHGRTHLVDGGRREEKIAADYAAWAQRVEAKYPSTARILRGLQEDYARQVVQERQRADRADQFG